MMKTINITIILLISMIGCKDHEHQLIYRSNSRIQNCGIYNNKLTIISTGRDWEGSHLDNRYPASIVLLNTDDFDIETKKEYPIYISSAQIVDNLSVCGSAFSDSLFAANLESGFIKEKHNPIFMGTRALKYNKELKLLAGCGKSGIYVFNLDLEIQYINNNLSKFDVVCWADENLILGGYEKNLVLFDKNLEKCRTLYAGKFIIRHDIFFIDELDAVFFVQYNQVIELNLATGESKIIMNFPETIDYFATTNDYIYIYTGNYLIRYTKLFKTIGKIRFEGMISSVVEEGDKVFIGLGNGALYQYDISQFSKEK